MEHDDEVVLVPVHPHSGLGLSAFVVSLLCCALLVIAAVSTGVVEVSEPGGLDETSHLGNLLLGAMVTGTIGLVVALALAIAGLCQRQRRRLFALLALLLSAGTLIALLALLWLGTSL